MQARVLSAALISSALACLAPLPASAATELVQNGGFEAGDFSNWSASGGFVGVDGFAPHSGSYGAYAGTVGSAGSFSQTLSTVAGGLYTISFWLQNEADSFGNVTPNSFSVLFGSNSVFSLTNSPAFGYKNYSFDAVATGASTALTFSASHSPAFWDVDDVSVTASPAAVPEPATWLLMLVGFGSVGAALRGARRRSAARFEFA